MSDVLSPTAILRAWEWGSNRHPIDRALLLLWSAEEDGDDPAALPVAERDRRLIALRQRSFGDTLPCTVDCPGCGQVQEFDLSAAELLQTFETDTGAPPVLRFAGWEVRLKRLDSRDLAAAARCPDTEAAVDALIERAIVAVKATNGDIASERLPDGIRSAVADELANHDGAADVTLDLVCGNCGECWCPAFDVAAYLWREVETEARRLLVEIATLAQRFGWSESDILAMSPMRRRAYLTLGSEA